MKDCINQRLYVRGRVYSNIGRPTEMKIGLYNMKKGKIVATREVTSKLEGNNFEYYFYNCNPTTNYAIAFATVYDGFSYDSVHVSAVVYH